MGDHGQLRQGALEPSVTPAMKLFAVRTVIAAYVAVLAGSLQSDTVRKAVRNPDCQID
jgi:hypothetical protein